MAARLTDKQKRFITEYLVDLNATQAAIRAGYSAKTAQAIGTENLSKPLIQAALQEAMQKRSRRTEITQDRVLLELARIGFCDPRKLFDDDGNPLPISAIDDDTAASISLLDVDVTIDEDGTITRSKRYRFSDKLRALEMIAKHIGMCSGATVQLSIDPDTRAAVERFVSNGLNRSANAD